MVDAHADRDRTVSLPDQEAIEQALASLDRKLTAWHSAMVDAHRALRDLTDAATEPVCADPGTETETDIGDRVPAHDPEPHEAPVESQGSCTDSQPEASVEAKEIDELRDEPAVEQVPEEQQASSPAPANEEEILAGLDEEAIRKITIMRRLNPDQDLAAVVELYRNKATCSSESVTKPKPKPAKRSWWRSSDDD